MNRERFLEWFWLIIKYSFVTGVLALLLRGFLLIPIPVQGSSMEDTMAQGDMAIMERLSSVKRFDVVVFNLPDGSTYVKRVIGLPGESVSYENDQLYIDGKKMEEPFLEENLHEDDESVPYTYDFDFEELMGVEKLGKDSYFVIGDNRRFSKDSRSFGAISEDEILGTIRFVYYPLPHMKFI
ncbi:signal peptidase I [Tetragenococcus osmophilus]|uniref:Signal peptidase I n=2 Tax=Tetragenococcus osmophilus TaxID=526944 RepID=A0ABM7ABB1_9ENTE|nr:signal peptidase I [Tetragenococcus osmophilus]AYW48751.1 signal peptidase I [Tetragenococcus osmophilus]